MITSKTMIRLRIICMAVVCFTYLRGVQGEGIGTDDQEWGYAQVRPGAHMFWWLFYTTNEKVSSFMDRPLLIWLQGGPGVSGTGYGNFNEVGPYDVNLRPRNYSWVKDYNVLFIDSPVGTGFSYVQDSSVLARNNTQMVSDLLECIRAFYWKRPPFTEVPVYMVAESYAGKQAVELGLVWYKAQKAGSIKSNLKGVELGDTWISPISNVLTWAPFLLQTGMIDSEGYKAIEASANRTRDAVKNEDWALATTLWDDTENLIVNKTESIDFYNILSKKRLELRKPSKFRVRSKSSRVNECDASDLNDAKLDRLMNTVVKRALNLNQSWCVSNTQVFNAQYEDFMRPVTDIVDRLLDETELRVFVHQGQLDLIVDTPGTLSWVENLKSRFSEKWKTAPRQPVVVKGVIEGYKKTFGNFAFYWVIRAGHMVPNDNPAATSVILKDLTN